MGGQIHKLKHETIGGWVRRVVVEKMVNLPARSEMDVHGRVVYRDLKDPWDTWVSIPGARLRKCDFRALSYRPAVLGSRYVL